ncbi:MAG: tail fiber domain-containing protein [Tannerellaceae bacterium]|jgi:hypothetical protein|nr:tail fiber domain-containing protein [Tannerellaceae bacterium]
MKRSHLLLCLFVLYGLGVQAQLRVLPNGRVQAGSLKDNNEDLGNATSMQIFGKNGEMRTESKLSFGDFGHYDNQGWNVFVGEYKGGDTDQLWLHGKLGIYLTTSGRANSEIAYYNPLKGSSFVFNTNLWVNGVTITSDARLKENVRPLSNPLDLLSRVSGVSYNYSFAEIQKNRKPDESGLSASVNETQVSADAGSSAKDAEYQKIQAEIDSREAQDAARTRIGFLAQDVQKVLPELVQTDDKGVMSIDYIGFIPLIVESIKQMQATIEEQRKQIEALLSMAGGTEADLRSAVSTGEADALGEAKLYDAPGASVAYVLPADYSAAHLQVYDIAGKLLKNLKLDNSAGRVDLNGGETGYGAFIYALVVDGRKRDTLKKFINRQ